MTRLEQVVHDSERLSARSKSLYAASVRLFVGHAGADERRWSPALVKDWRDALRGTLSPQSVNGHLAGLKFAFRRFAAMQYGQDAAAPVEYLKNGPRTRNPEALTAEESRALLATTAGPSVVDRRDRVILHLGLVEGLRRAEMVSLRWEQVASGKLVGLVRKGGKVEAHPLDASTIAAIEALAAMLPVEATERRRPLLTRARNCIGCEPRPLSVSGIYAIVSERAKQAGLKVAPHELRHTCGSLALQNGVPPWRVAKHLAHESESTTMRTYAHDLAAEEGESVGRSVARMLETISEEG